MKRGPKPILKPYRHKKTIPITRDFEHAERIRVKALEIATLKALLHAHLEQSNKDMESIHRLRRRIREKEQQLTAMRP